MDKLFEDFTKPSYTDWVNQLTKDLKGESEQLIQRIDTIEELNFNSYQHQDSPKTNFLENFENPYIRGSWKQQNAWENLGTVIVSDEKEANKKALTLLNLGATALRFELKKETVNWNELMNEIQLEYIQTTFKLANFSQFSAIVNQFKQEELSTVYFELELNDVSKKQWAELAQNLKQQQRFTLLVNGYAVQQCGATTWQEVGYSLSVAHEFLSTLIENGLTVDEAAACIHFNVGVGATYFYEIAKIRVLRLLWARILEEYNPEHNCSYSARITGLTGFTNKSLKDPHTNLLRQTTEAMSLAFAGVHALCVQPYDLYSTKGATTLSTRMAVNIPLVLQEESYLDKVIDPLGGSYVLEFLTTEIAEKSWSYFQKIEELGGVESAIDFISTSISEKALARKQRIADKQDSLIGINIFPNPTTENNEWLAFEEYLGMKQLNLEQSI